MISPNRIVVLTSNLKAAASPDIPEKSAAIKPLHQILNQAVTAHPEWFTTNRKNTWGLITVPISQSPLESGAFPSNLIFYKKHPSDEILEIYQPVGTSLSPSTGRMRVSADHFRFDASTRVLQRRLFMGDQRHKPLDQASPIITQDTLDPTAATHLQNFNRELRQVFFKDRVS